MNSTNTLNSSNDKIYNIIFKSNTVHIKHHVELKNSDLVNASSLFVGDPKFDDIKYIAWDFSDITILSTDGYTAELLTTINERIRRINSNVITIFITDKIKLRNTIKDHIGLLKTREPNTMLLNSISEFIVWLASKKTRQKSNL